MLLRKYIFSTNRYGAQAAPYWENLTDVVNDVDERLARIERALAEYLSSATDNQAAAAGALTLLNEELTR